MPRKLFSLILLILGLLATPAAAREGVSDLSIWKGYQSGKLLPLKEWRFLPQVHAPPQEFRDWGSKSRGISAPQNWSEWSPKSKVTYGTFLLEFSDFPMDMVQPAITDVYLYSAFKIFVIYLGKKNELKVLPIGRQGKLGTDRQSTIPFFSAEVFPFPLDDEKPIALVIHVSNFEVLPGGFQYTPRFGEAKDAFKFQEKDRLEGMLILGMLLLITMFNFAIYIQRREDRSNLFLFLFCFFSVLRYIGLEDLISYFNPEPSTMLFRLNWTLLRGYMVAPAFACYITFFYLTFEGKIPPIHVRVLWAFTLLTGGVAAFTILFPGQASVANYAIGASFLSFYVILIALRIANLTSRKIPGSLLAAISLIILIGSFINDMLVFMKFTQGATLERYGLVIFALLQSLIIAQRFAIGFRRVRRWEVGLRREVKQQTLEIRSMLDNMKQGMFLVGHDLRILPHYSKQLEDIVGERKLTGKDAFELLFAGSDVKREIKERLGISLKNSFGKNVDEFDKKLGSIIKEFKKDIPSQTSKILEIDWGHIRNSQGTLEKVLVTVRDITKIRSLEKDSETRRSDQIIAQNILSVPEYIINDFLESTRQTLDENEKLIEQTHADPRGSLGILLRNYYSLRAMSSIYRFHAVVDLIRTTEETIRTYMAQPGSLDQTLLEEMNQNIRHAVQRHEWINQEQLGRRTGRSFNLVKRRDLKDDLRILTDVACLPLPQSAKDALRQVCRHLMGIVHCPPQLVAEEINLAMQRLAKDKGTESPKLDFEAEGLVFTQDAFMKLRPIFLHLVRNTFDHGFEGREERLRKGKGELGTVIIRWTIDSQSLRLTYRDDGRGLPMQRALQIGIDKGVFSTATTPENIAAAMLQGGLSTASTKEDERGLGMLAVKQKVEAEGGQLVGRLLDASVMKEYMAFEVEIILPRNLAMQI